MKRLGVFPLPLDGMLVHRTVNPSINLAAIRVKCLVQELEPWPLDPESSAQTIRPPKK